MLVCDSSDLGHTTFVEIPANERSTLQVFTSEDGDGVPRIMQESLFCGCLGGVVYSCDNH